MTRPVPGATARRAGQGRGGRAHRGARFGALADESAGAIDDDGNRDALRIDIALFGENHAYVAGDYESIGICYMQIGDAQMARAYFQKSLEIAKTAFGEKDVHAAALYDHIGATYGNQRNDKQALDYYQKSLNNLKEAGEHHSPQILVISDGKSVLDLSHYDIDFDRIKPVIK